MIKSIFAAAMLLAAFTAHAQVRITSLSPTGRLSWTNLVRPSDGLAIYKVEWAPTLNGAPVGFLRVTNQTQIILTNFPTAGPAPHFYRVIWENGQVWSLNLYASQSLVVTGKLYLASVYGSLTQGKYDLKYLSGTGAPGWIFFAPRGDFIGGEEGFPSPQLHLLFYNHQVISEFPLEFTLDGPPPVAGIWTGTWSESYPLGGETIYGTFVAQRLTRGN